MNTKFISGISERDDLLKLHSMWPSQPQTAEVATWAPDKSRTWKALSSMLRCESGLWVSTRSGWSFLARTHASSSSPPLAEVSRDPLRWSPWVPGTRTCPPLFRCPQPPRPPASGHRPHTPCLKCFRLHTGPAHLPTIPDF